MGEHDLNLRAAQDQMLSKMADTFNNQAAYPDIEIVCAGQKWLCHKVILSRSSEWFERAFGGEFKERDAKSIELHEDFEDPGPAIEAMLKYCYTFGYDSSTDPSSVTFDIRMFALAEKYFIKNLDRLAAGKLKPALENVSSDKMEEVFAEAIAEIYTNTADPENILRNTIISPLLARIDLETFIDSKTCQNLMTDFPPFALDLSRTLIQQNKKAKEETKNSWIEQVHPDGSTSHYNKSTHQRRTLVKSAFPHGHPYYTSPTLSGPFPAASGYTPAGLPNIPHDHPTMPTPFPPPPTTSAPIRVPPPGPFPPPLRSLTIASPASATCSSSSSFSTGGPQTMRFRLNAPNTRNLQGPLPPDPQIPIPIP